MLKTLTLILLLFFTVSQSHAMPFPRFLKSCQDVVQNFFGSKKADFSGKAYLPPDDAHASHVELFKNLESSPHYTQTYPHLPYMEQTLKRFKDTDEPFIEYFMSSGDWSKKGYKEFIENTAEVLFTPHSSLHGHIRLRIGTKVYGYENVSRSFMGTFEPDRLFKQERKLKRGSKAGNIGVVYVLSAEQKELLATKMKDIDRFYSSSERYNMPPFDGRGEKEIKILRQENGTLKYHSPAPPSAYGNRKGFSAELVTEGDSQFLVAPNGIRHLVKKNENDELVTEGYSCASSAGHTMRNFLGLNVKDMPYAGSFLTHLKNGAEGFTKPDAVIHYYPSSDL